MTIDPKYDLPLEGNGQGKTHEVDIWLEMMELYISVHKLDAALDFDGTEENITPSVQKTRKEMNNQLRLLLLQALSPIKKQIYRNYTSAKLIFQALKKVRESFIHKPLISCSFSLFAHLFY
jgi:hypothetical protein